VDAAGANLARITQNVVVGYVVELDKNDTTPYDVAVSAPFTIH